MTDESQATNKTESAETPQAPMPSADKTPLSEQAPSSDIKLEAGTAPQDATLPEGVKERTTLEFEKLKTQLREEKEKRMRAERINQLYPNANQTPFSNPAEPTYQTDADRISRAEQMAQQAYLQSQRVMKENDAKQESEAYQAHPELDPNKKEFDEDYQRAVIGYLASIMAEGKSMSLKEAASKVKSFSKSDLKKAQEQGVTQAIESLTPKEQASLEATGRSDRRVQIGGLEELRQRSRKGDSAAILKRLKNIPIVGR
jgi:prolyl oligopeptidase PreP (S9A serine peptidase family)